MTLALNAQARVFVATNSTWRYFKGTSEASDPTNAWRELDFDDAAWLVGAAPFHFGTNTAGGDDGQTGGTMLSDMRSNYTCIFLRQTFVIDDTNSVQGLWLNAYYDDGFAVWINGQPPRNTVGVRGNSLAYTNTANVPTREANTVMRLDISSGAWTLRNGTNVLCLQAFNGHLTNNDFRIEVELAEGLPTLNFAAATTTVSEDAGQALLTVLRTGTQEAVTVDYATLDWLGLAGDDFLAASGTLTFAPGQIEQTIAVPILNDSVEEPAETFQVKLSNPGGGAVLGATNLATVWIQDEDPTSVDLMVVYTPQALQDAGGEAPIRAEIDGLVAEANRCLSNSQVNARFTLVHRGVVDYTETAAGDAVDLIRLRDPSDGHLDDVHHLRDIYKADLVMLFTWGPAGRANVFTGIPSRAFSLVGRYVALAERWIPTHELGHNFGPYDRITPTSPSQPLANRFVAGGVLYRTLVAYDPGVSIPYLSGTTVIYQGAPTGSATDNDAGQLNQNAVTIAGFRVATSRFAFPVAQYLARESVRTTAVEVVRVGAKNTAASVELQVLSGTAQAGVDFVPQTNYLFFAPGVARLACEVTILNDAVCKGDRTVRLLLQPADFGSIQGDALGLQDSAELVIQEDEPGFVLGATNGLVLEGAGTVTVSIRRVGDTGLPGSVALATRDGTALAGLNYVSANTVLSFASGEAEKRVDIGILNDGVPGPDLRFSVELQNPSAGTGLGSPRSTTIRLLDSQRFGSLDTGFDPQGGPNRLATVVAPRPDGKILCGGQFTRVNGHTRAGLVQLNPDGSVDTDFQPVRIAVGPAPEDGAVYGNVYAIVEQKDGRILVGGEFPSVNGVRRPNLARFNADATLDTGFPLAAPNGRVTAMAVQPDGRILICGGFTQVGSEWHPLVARLNPDGSLDPTFSFSSAAGFAGSQTLALQPDGKILLLYADGSWTGVCIRLRADGTQDSEFVSPTVFPVGGALPILAVLPNGQILITGRAETINGDQRHLLARLNPDGALDATFNARFASNALVTALAPLPDGRLLVAGRFSLTNSPARQNLVRLNVDGSLDGSFDVGSGPNDFVFHLAAQSDGSLYLAGAFTMINERSMPYVARLRLDETCVRFEAPIWDENQLRLRLRGPPGVYALETSPDLRTWTPLVSVTNWAGRAECLEAPPAGQNTRFYRAVVK